MQTEKILAIFPEATEEQKQAVRKLFRAAPKMSSGTPNRDGNVSERRLAAFEISRKAYKGTKDGMLTEYNRLLANVHKNSLDLDTILRKIPFSIAYQEDRREAARSTGEFVPPWKNFGTWINQSNWDTEFPSMSGSSWYKGLTEFEKTTLKIDFL